MTSDVIKWLNEARKLDVPLLEAYQVAERDHPQIGRVAAFPYIRDGKPYAAKFRSEDKQWRSSQGVTRGLYNADCLRQGKDLPIVITEGEIDCLSVIQAGYVRAVSLPDGWTEQGNKTEALVEAADDLRDAPAVIVAGDNDQAGESLPRTVANLLRGQVVKFVEWPEGCKDANDVLMLHGEGAVAEALNKAKVMDPPGGFITSISNLPPMSDRRVLRTGQMPFDRGLAFELGALSVATGMPGNGKSTLVTWVMEHVSRHESVRIGMLAFETHPHRIRDHLARINHGIPWAQLPATMQRRLEGILDERWRIVHRTFDGVDHHIGWLEQMVYTLATREGCKVIVIDPWNELEHLPNPGESMTSYINWAIQQIRIWAEKLEVHICLVAHPRKMPTDRVRAPTGYDIADSAAFFNKPSLGFTVHQSTDEHEYPVVQLHTWKVRDAQLYGISKGVCECEFDEDKMTYHRRLMETEK
ncbi:MAG: AAA family ATPase [Pseudomonadota bacterium]